MGYQRGRWSRIGVLIEWPIRISGISAILFVFGIFFFVFKEGAGFLVTKWKPVEFFTSRNGITR